jgi:hypothetical protein
MEVIIMTMSTRSRRTAVVTLLPIMLVVVSHTGSAFSQQATTTPSKIDINKFHSGMKCRVEIDSSSQSGTHAPHTYTGTIKEVAKDEIVLITGISEGRNEYRTPVLGKLPFVGKYFTHVYIGRAEITKRIPVAKITSIELLTLPTDMHSR